MFVKPVDTPSTELGSLAARKCGMRSSHSPSNLRQELLRLIIRWHLGHGREYRGSYVEENGPFLLILQRRALSVGMIGTHHYA